MVQHEQTSSVVRTRRAESLGYQDVEAQSQETFSGCQLCGGTSGRGRIIDYAARSRDGGTRAWRAL